MSFSSELCKIMEKIHLIASGIINAIHYTEAGDRFPSFDNIKEMQKNALKLQSLINHDLQTFVQQNVIFYHLLSADNKYQDLDNLSLLLENNSKDFNQLSTSQKSSAVKYLTDQVKALFKIKTYAYLWLTKNNEEKNYKISHISSSSSDNKPDLKIYIEDDQLVCRASLAENTPIETARIQKNIDENNTWASEDEITFIKNVSDILKRNNISPSDVQYIESAKESIYKAFKRSILINRSGTIKELQNFILTDQKNNDFNTKGGDFKIELTFVANRMCDTKQVSCKYKFNIHPGSVNQVSKADFYKSMINVIVQGNIEIKKDFNGKSGKFKNITEVINLVVDNTNVFVKPPAESSSTSRPYLWRRHG
jgi:hypothetical protein